MDDASGIAPSKDSNQLPEKVKTVWAPTLRRDPSQASDSLGWGPRRTASGANSSSQVRVHCTLIHCQPQQLQSTVLAVFKVGLRYTLWVILICGCRSKTVCPRLCRHVSCVVYTLNQEDCEHTHIPGLHLSNPSALDNQHMNTLATLCSLKPMISCTLHSSS